MLDEPLHAAGEGTRSHSELRGTDFHLLAQHDHGPDLLVGDLVRVEECCLEGLPFSRRQASGASCPRATALWHDIPAFSLQANGAQPSNTAERLPV
jgi:hypothetical protein